MIVNSTQPPAYVKRRTWRASQTSRGSPPKCGPAWNDLIPNQSASASLLTGELSLRQRAADSALRSLPMPSVSSSNWTLSGHMMWIVLPCTPLDSRIRPSSRAVEDAARCGSIRRRGTVAGDDVKSDHRARPSNAADWQAVIADSNGLYAHFEPFAYLGSTLQQSGRAADRHTL